LDCWACAICSVDVRYPPTSPQRGQSPTAAIPNNGQGGDKIILKYQQSTCEQLWIQKSQKAPPTLEEQKAIAFLRSDPQMRTAFIAKVAPPIANKMFDCGMIP